MPTDVEENSYSSHVQSGVVTDIRSLCTNIQIASEKGLGDSDDNFLSSPSHPGVYASNPNVGGHPNVSLVPPVVSKC